MDNSHATDVEKISWYAQVWRQADKDAIADKRNVQKQRAEYRARRRLREAVDIAIRRAARNADSDVGRLIWRRHVSRLTCRSFKQRGKYRLRRQTHRAVEGWMRPTFWPALLAAPQTGSSMPRLPRRRVIIS